MEANELRIGNLLKDTYSVEWGISGVHEFGVDCFNDNEETYMEYENFKPIPLTEEWLLKFGFKQSDNDLFELIVVNNEEIQYDIWFRGESGLYANIESFQVVTEQQTNLPFLHIKNVHQLQNLYFALTNEELTIKTK